MGHDTKQLAACVIDEGDGFRAERTELAGSSVRGARRGILAEGDHGGGERRMGSITY